jgi:hypothetical protein
MMRESGAEPIARASTVPSQRAELNSSFRRGRRYAVRGLETLRVTPFVIVAIMVMFSLPAAGVIWITAADLPMGLGRTAGTTVLNLLSGTVAPVFFIKAVAAAHEGRRPGLWRHLQDGTRWLPRYIWTNLHTTVIFWVPVGILTLGLISYQRLTFAESFPGGLVSMVWIVVIGGTGIYVHSRTLLAPFIAVHGNVPGSLAALESWRVTRRGFGPVLATLVIASAPIAAPLAVLFMGFYLTLSGPALDVLTATLAAQVWIAINFIRPPLVAATYALYTDVWPGELERRAQQGHPATPALVRWLIDVSWWPPRVAAAMFRRPVSGPL